MKRLSVERSPLNTRFKPPSSASTRLFRRTAGLAPVTPKRRLNTAFKVLKWPHELILILAEQAVEDFDSQTALHGQGSPRLLTDLRSDDHLRIHGPPLGENTVLATKVVRNAASPTVQLESFVTTATDPIVVLVGVSIDTSSIAESGFKGAHGVKGRTAFFTGLSSGMTVRLGGTVLGDTIVWSSAWRDD